jgi:hypothetical protein
MGMIAGLISGLCIRMTYKPPAGALGHAVASLLGSDPKRAMDEDLLRFKSLLEEGKASARGPTITREALGADLVRPMTRCLVRGRRRVRRRRRQGGA